MNILHPCEGPSDLPPKNGHPNSGTRMKTKLSSPRKHAHTHNGHGHVASAAPRKMLINGQWVAAESGETFSTYNPATGEVICEVAAGGKPDIDRAVKAARAAFESGPW